MILGRFHAAVLSSKVRLFVSRSDQLGLDGRTMDIAKDFLQIDEIKVQCFEQFNFKAQFCDARHPLPFLEPAPSSLWLS